MIKGKISLFIIFALIVTLTGISGVFLAVNMSKANKINKEKLEFIIDKKEKVYDGGPLELTSITLDESYTLPNGYSYDFVCNDTITNVGIIYPNPNIIIYDNYGKNVTALYDCIITDNGGLSVTKRPIDITFNSNSKAYDGTPLNTTTFDVTNGSLAIGQRAVPDYKSEALAVGESVEIKAVTHVLDINGSDVTDNYFIEDNLSGDNIPVFEITGNVLTVFTTDQEWVYDGKPHSYSEFLYDGLRPGDTVKVTESKTIIDVKDSGINDVDPDCIEIVDSDGVSVKEKYEIEVKPIGNLTITPYTLKIARNDTVVVGKLKYTGEPQSLEVSPERISELGLLLSKDLVLLGNYKLKCTSSQGTEVGQYNAELYIADDNDVTTENFVIDQSYYGKVIFEIVEDIDTFEVKFDLVDKPTYTKVYDGEDVLATDVYKLTPESLSFLDRNEYTCVYSFKNPIKNAKNYTGADLDLNVVFKDKSGKEVTDIQVKKPTSLTLITISQRIITMITGSATKVYDGSPLYCTNYTLSGLPEKFVFEPYLDIDDIPKLNKVGKKDNELEWDDILLDGVSVRDNFKLNVIPGTLEITKAVLNVFVNDVTITYGSNPESIDTDKLTYTTSGSGTNIPGIKIGLEVNASENTIEAYLISDISSKECEFNYVAGNINYSKKTIYVLTKSKTKAYDGNPLYDDEPYVSDLANGDKFIVTSYTEITGVGSIDNFITFKIVKESNPEIDVTDKYDVRISYGTLTVTA